MLFGITINVYALLISSALVEFADHAILDQNMMALIVFVNLDISEIEIYVPHVTNHAANAQAPKPTNANHAQMLV